MKEKRKKIIKNGGKKKRKKGGGGREGRGEQPPYPCDVHGVEEQRSAEIAEDVLDARSMAAQSCRRSDVGIHWETTDHKGTSIHTCLYITLGKQKKLI